MKSRKSKKPRPRGGPRPNSGRPVKANKGAWGQITCILRLDTIEQLREGARSKRFGDYLQYHLDRHPLPSWDAYQAMIKRVPLITEIKGRRTPVIISVGGPTISSMPVPRRRPRTEKQIEEALAKALR